jgi:hypothetical protein
VVTSTYWASPKLSRVDVTGKLYRGWPGRPDTVSYMVTQPRLGGAFGELMHAALAEESGAGQRPTVGGTLPRGVAEIVAGDDGLIRAAPAELEDLVGATPWRMEEVDDADAPLCKAILRLR